MNHNFDMLDYLFDLRGFIILENAVGANLLDRLNNAIDPYLDMKFEEWRNNVQRYDNNGDAGIELQNIVEGGQPFEELIIRRGRSACCATAAKKTATWKGCLLTSVSLPCAGRAAFSPSTPATMKAMCATNTALSTTNFAAGRSTFCWL